MGIEKVLHEKAWGLEIDTEQNASVLIVDEELDPYQCVFNNDGCIEINTSGYTHITLSVEALYRIIELIEIAEEHYETNLKL